MANTLPVVKMLAMEMMRIAKTKKGLIQAVNKDYNQYWTDSKVGPIGDTLNVKVPPKYLADEGAEVTYTNDTVVKTVPLKLKQAKVVLGFSVWEENFDIDDYSVYLEAAVDELLGKIDAEGLALAKFVPNTTGSYTKQITKKSVSNAVTLLDKEGAPRSQRSFVVSADAEATIVDSFSILFNNQSRIGEQYNTRSIGPVYYMDTFSDMNVYTHTFSSTVSEAVTINGANQKGDSISVSGLTDAPAAGETFTIDGVGAAAGAGRAPTGNLRFFTVQEGSTASVIKITPALIVDGQEKNVTGSPANSAKLNWVGEAGKSVDFNLAFHRDALTLACVPTYVKDKGVESYTIKDKETGLAFRVTKDYTFDKDAERMRVDAVYGWALTRPEFAVKVMSVKGLLEE